MKGPFVFSSAPARVYWEITRACDLACRHCRAEAAPCADPAELDTPSGLHLLEQLASSETPAPHVIFTGGDPLKRADLFQLIARARELGMHVSVSPSATPLLTEEAIARLKDAGVEAISLSIDGADAERHEAIRGVTGCWERTLRAARRAAELGLAFQVNTLVAEETVDQLPEIEKVVRSIGAARWSLFFLVSVGRGTVLRPITPERCERLLEWLSERASEPGLVITTTEAPQFRRVVMQQGGGRRPGGHPGAQPHPHAAAGIRDGNGVMFISNDGEVCPSGFLPLSAGNVKRSNPLELYRTSPLFQSMRDPDRFGGRCGVCQYRAVCGGSRARAWSATGDPLAEDPLCTHQPGRKHEAPSP